ncbi:MAG TPA: MoxR family ATPase [Chthoniobacterales bacterium]|nr:MoxR family ATPase [Chthoniobacterales bacterium]
MKYNKRFEPERVESFESNKGSPSTVGDQREGSVYVYEDKVVLAVNVALATGRPLLVRGPSGSGKSSLARNVANNLRWRYYEKVISSRTQARDLLWQVDLLHRLHDAQIPGKEFEADFTPYIQPGVLWWAFNRESAKRRGVDPTQSTVGAPLKDPNQGHEATQAVVLLDEIDKADPDVPNNLLVPLGSLQFQVEETQAKVETSAENAPLVFITTNDERELPTAFLRRCVEIQLPKITRPWLLEVGKAHFPEIDHDKLESVANCMASQDNEERDDSQIPSPAEYIDTVRACDRLKVWPPGPGEPQDSVWQHLSQITLWKHGRQGERTT